MMRRSLCRPGQFPHDLILELMTRGDMRIGEVLKLTLNDIDDRKLIHREPKSGRSHEIAA